MTDAELLAAAAQARERAYAPYSRFRVGAALLGADGQLYRGCNIENAAYGLCNCAERTAFFAALAAGAAPRRFARLAVLADTPGPVAPCGACRQVMWELGGPDLPVLLANTRGDWQAVRVADLLPGAFDAGVLPDPQPEPQPRPAG